MQFPRGNTNLKMIQHLESTKQPDDCEMGFSITTMNQPVLFNNCPSSSIHALYRCLGSNEETLAQTRYLISEQETVRFAQRPHQLDDLTAIVEKCNVEGFNKSALSIPRMFRVPHQEYGMLSSSVDSIPKKAQIRRETGGTAKRAPELVFSKENGGVEEEHESLVRKRSGSGFLMTSSLVRENHILSERLRRTEMNELFSQMRSLLPKTTPKSDKASIVHETINYIECLQRQLVIRSSKNVITPKSSEAMMSGRMLENGQTPPSECNGSDDNSPDGNLTVNFNGKNIFITINCAKKANLLTSIILLLELHSIEVMDAFVVITETGAFHCLQSQSVQILNRAAEEILLGMLNKLLKADYKIYLG